MYLQCESYQTIQIIQKNIRLEKKYFHIMKNTDMNLK